LIKGNLFLGAKETNSQGPISTVFCKLNQTETFLNLTELNDFLYTHRGKVLYHYKGFFVQKGQGLLVQMSAKFQSLHTFQ